MDADGRNIPRGDEGGRFRYRRDAELVPGILGDEDLPGDERWLGRGRHFLDLRHDHGGRHRIYILLRTGNQGENLPGDSGGIAGQRSVEQDERLNCIDEFSHCSVTAISIFFTRERYLNN